jgi:ATP-dependent Clp protease protease subunit
MKRFVNAALESRVNTIVSRHASRSALGSKFGNRAANAKPGYEFRNAAGDEADIFIYDEISSWWGIGANDFVHDLNDLDATTINLYINSPGGSVFEGYAIYASLNRYAEKNDAKINVIVDGWAASIASVIAMAGDHIKIGAHASVMVHEPSSFVWGTASEMREEADVLDEIEEAIVDIYVARTGGDRKEIQDWVTAETWFKGQAAVDAGFADEVIPLKTKKKEDGAEDVAKAKPSATSTADYFDLAFPHMPADVRADLIEATVDGEELPRTTREFRNFLRNAGFSGKQADAIAGNGFKPKTEPRDAAADELEKPTPTERRDDAEKRDEAVIAITALANAAALKVAALTLNRK